MEKVKYKQVTSDHLVIESLRLERGWKKLREKSRRHGYIHAIDQYADYLSIEMARKFGISLISGGLDGMELLKKIAELLHDEVKAYLPDLLDWMNEVEEDEKFFNDISRMCIEEIEQDKPGFDPFSCSYDPFNYEGELS